MRSISARLTLAVLLTLMLSYASTASAEAIWQGGTAWWGGSNWNVDDVADQTPPGGGNTFTIDTGVVQKSNDLLGGNSTYHLGGDGAFQFVNEVDVFWDDVYISDNFALSATYLKMSNSYTGNIPSRVTMSGGSVTLSAANALRGPNFANVWFNLTAEPGAATITQTNNTNAGSTLTAKVNADFFRIDGSQVLGTGVANAVHGKYLDVATAGNTQTMSIAQNGTGVVDWQGGTGWYSDENWDAFGTADQNHPAWSNNITQINTGTVKKTTLSSGGNAIWQIGGDGTFSIESSTGNPQGWTVNWDDITISEGGTVEADFIDLRNAYDSAIPSRVTLESGNLIVHNANSFRGAKWDTQWFNLTGDADSTTITQTNNSTAGSSLTSKIDGGYFRVDGIRAYGTGPESAIHGKSLDVTVNGNEQTMTISQLPAPTAGQYLFDSDFDASTATGAAATSTVANVNAGTAIGTWADNSLPSDYSTLRVIDDGTGNNALWMDSTSSEPDFDMSAHLIQSVDLVNSGAVVDFSTAVRRISGPKNAAVYGLDEEGNISFYLLLDEDDDSIRYKTSGDPNDLDAGSTGMIDLTDVDIAEYTVGPASAGAGDFLHTSDAYDPMQLTDFSLLLGADGWTLDLTRYDPATGEIVEAYTTVPLPYFNDGATSLAELRFVGQDQAGFFFDNISVMAVPEPSTCVLALFGLMGLYLFRKRRCC